MSRNPVIRFDKWHSTLPTRTRFLVRLVLDEIVPAFAARGFERYPDYARGRTDALNPNTIALQRRDGDRWPTVELQFGSRGRPFLNVCFSALPDMCYRFGVHDEGDIPRVSANVVEGEAFFSLCKGHARSFDTSFGIASTISWTIFWEKRVRSEVDQLHALLPFLFQLFDDGIPADWTGQVGKVHRHVWVNRGAQLLRRLQSDADAGETNIQGVA